VNVIVIGGGITGRLVQFVVPEARVLDWGRPIPSQLTRNWGTNYLWEPLEGLSCRRFAVVTEVDGQTPDADNIARYKAKIGKRVDGGDWSRQFQHRMDGYELDALPEAVIEYETRIVEINVTDQRVVTSKGEVVTYDQLVSTIPLYSLLELLHPTEVGTELSRLAEHPFRSSAIYVRVQPRPLDAPYPPDTLYVNYLSRSDVEPYRFCDRGQTRHYEGLTSMGLPTKKLVPGKLLPPYPHTSLVLDVLRSCYNIYCFGRYARWAPDELVHETYRDIRQWGKDRA
jgi:hypothetical protein